MGCGPSSFCLQCSVHLLQDGWSAQLLIFLCGPDFQWVLMYETEIFMFCALLSVVLPHFPQVPLPDLLILNLPDLFPPDA